MKKILVLGLLAYLPVLAHAEGCREYPYSDGINIEDVEGGTKILSTATVSVPFDDIDAVLEAKDEATVQAKAAISKFMTEDISSDESIRKAVDETRSMRGATKQATREEVISRVKTFRNSSRSLLRGAVPLGDCYTKGLEVRVTVGIKPGSINSAGNLADSISNNNPRRTSQPGQPSPGNSEAGSGAEVPLQGVDSQSNTDRLREF